MGIWDKLRGEFIDIIQWTDETSDTMVYRFERHGNEIKNGAQLTVRESQVAVFVSEGQIADVFQPGMYTLETKNLPILSTIQGWKYGFNSPFKAEVYFVNTKRFTDLKWGTLNPIMMRDADFGMVRVRAFGTYSMRVKDAGLFLREVVGTNWEFTTDQIAEQMRNFIVSTLAEGLAETKVPVLDLYSKYREVGEMLTQKIQPKFGEHGLELLNLLIENVSVPAEVEAAIDTRSKIGAMGGVMTEYMQVQAGEAMVKGAENPGGVGGLGAQMAAGQIAAQMATQGMQPPPQASPPPAAPAPPPIPTQMQYHVVVGGQQQGPFGPAELSGMIADGTLTRETLVWTGGMANWMKAGDVPEVAGLFANTPPPIPGE
ncbi:MAG: SPFH domain-containing protein [Fimbriimonadaceae bacterium]|nr:SPFH domain-containing protein [Fimbriimonadaceae bacterium]QYK54776.1 MAG: SPFH domain-containing protein [Fimbriimonadaceae bacterium]